MEMHVGAVARDTHRLSDARSRRLNALAPLSQHQLQSPTPGRTLDLRGRLGAALLCGRRLGQRAQPRCLQPARLLVCELHYTVRGRCLARQNLGVVSQAPVRSCKVAAAVRHASCLLAVQRARYHKAGLHAIGARRGAPRRARAARMASQTPWPHI